MTPTPPGAALHFCTGTVGESGGFSCSICGQRYERAERKEAPDEAGLIRAMGLAQAKYLGDHFVEDADGHLASYEERLAMLEAIRPHLAPDTEVLDALDMVRRDKWFPAMLEQTRAAVSAILKARGR